MNELDKAEFITNAAKLSPEQVKAFAMSYLLGVAVGELLNLGFTEAEVREGFDVALQKGLDTAQPSRDPS